MNAGRPQIMPWLQSPWSLFQERMAADRLAHAMLLHGPRGTGKTQLAQAMVETLLCLDPRPDGACGTCRSCVLLESGAHPEAFRITIEVNRKTGKLRKEIVIEQIRELIGSMGLTTTISRRKIALIEPAEAMNRSTANALLKTLEEPPGDAVLILLSHEPSRLPATIRSRCQAMGVGLPSAATATAWLTGEHGLAEAEAKDALLAAGGSPALALEYHRQEQVGLFAELKGALESLFGGEDKVAAALAMLAHTDADTLWFWLSGLSRARALSIGPRTAAAADLLQLQLAADRNRRLVRTSVRGDLLLRDWLIEWCRAGARARG